MSRDNGDPDGLWPDENQLVPLSSSSAAVAPSPNGARPPWLDEGRAVARPISLSAGEFTTERMLRPAPNVPSGGWRRAVFTLSGGHIAMGPSPEELRQRELVARVKTPVTGCRKIAFISRKGGVGKTSTCLLVGHTFAIHRGDRVIAVDGNPDAGTLGHRVRRETTANLTSLLADASRIERYADVRGYTSQAPSRLEVVASDDDPRITQAIGEQEFHRAIELLERHYNLVCLDTEPGFSNPQLAASSRPPIRSSLLARRASTVLAPQAPPSTGLTRTGTTGSSASRSRYSMRSEGHLGLVDVGRIEEHFAKRCRACVRIPWDPHLEAGAEATVDDLQPTTRGAYLELAAAIGSGFVSPTERRPLP